MWAPTGGRLHIVPGTEALDANRSFLPYRQLGEKCARASGGSCPAIACRWRYVECATPVEPPRRAISCAVALVCVDQSRPEPSGWQRLRLRMVEDDAYPLPDRTDGSRRSTRR